jgi:hypothetical protein
MQQSPPLKPPPRTSNQSICVGAGERLPVGTEVLDRQPSDSSHCQAFPEHRRCLWLWRGEEAKRRKTREERGEDGHREDAESTPTEEAQHSRRRGAYHSPNSTALARASTATYKPNFIAQSTGTGNPLAVGARRAPQRSASKSAG